MALARPPPSPTPRQALALRAPSPPRRRRRSAATAAIHRHRRLDTLPHLLLLPRVVGTLRALSSVLRRRLSRRRRRCSSDLGAPRAPTTAPHRPAIRLRHHRGQDTTPPQLPNSTTRPLLRRTLPLARAIARLLRASARQRHRHPRRTRRHRPPGRLLRLTHTPQRARPSSGLRDRSSCRRPAPATRRPPLPSRPGLRPQARVGEMTINTRQRHPQTTDFPDLDQVATYYDEAQVVLEDGR